MTAQINALKPEFSCQANGSLNIGFESEKGGAQALEHVLLAESAQDSLRQVHRLDGFVEVGSRKFYRPIVPYAIEEEPVLLYGAFRAASFKLGRLSIGENNRSTHSLEVNGNVVSMDLIALQARIGSVVRPCSKRGLEGCFWMFCLLDKG